MATRRSFTLGSLVLALTGAQTARAREPQQLKPQQLKPQRRQPQPIQLQEGSQPPELKIALDARHKGSHLVVELGVENLGPAPVELVVRWGSRPGVTLAAQIEVAGEPLELAAVLEGDRREFISRLGPIPEWAPLAAGKSLKMGPYRFSWPDGVPVGEVRFTGHVSCESGEVTFERRIVLDDRPGGVRT